MSDKQDHRLFVLGYADEALANAAVAELEQLAQDEFLRDIDWAVVTKGADGKITTRESTRAGSGCPPGCGRRRRRRGADRDRRADRTGRRRGGGGHRRGHGEARRQRVQGEGHADRRRPDAGRPDECSSSIVAPGVHRDIGRRHRGHPEFMAADQTLESPVDGSSGNLLRAAVEDYQEKNTAG